MNPEEFEKAVATSFKERGYKCELRGGSYDYGVDIIAEKNNERIAIQVKMYDKRVVNYEAIMHLYAGKKLLDCTTASLITSGIVSDDAKTVAQKLDIKIFEYWSSNKN